MRTLPIINSCLTLAIQYEDREIQTIEGLAYDGTLHPMQDAFITHDGFQCGYGTPGQICSAVAMLAEWKEGAPSAVTKPDSPLQLSDDEVRWRRRGSSLEATAR